MIDEIKDEIIKKYNYTEKDKGLLIKLDEIIDILDKYKDQEENLRQTIIQNDMVINNLVKYKKAWNELYHEIDMPCGIEYMQELEAKYEIGDDK